MRSAGVRFITNRDWNGLPTEIASARANILRTRVEAKSLADYHSPLEVYQIAYRDKGGGARLHLGDASAKASTVAPDLVLKQLQARWGPFSPHPCDQVPGFDAYRAAHQAQLKRLRADRAAAQEVLNQWDSRQVVSIKTARNRLVELAIRAERDAAQKELNAAFAVAIKTCTDARHTKVDFWRAAGSPNDPPPVASPSMLLPAARVQRQAWTPPAELRAEHNKWSTRYYDAADRLVFTDDRRVIVVQRPSHADGLDTALKLAAEPLGTVRVSGAEAFKQRCAERAVELGIGPVDSDNKPLVAKRTVTSIGILNNSTVKCGAGSPRSSRRRGTQSRQERMLSDLTNIGTSPMRRSQIARHTATNAPLEMVVEVDRFDPKTHLTMAALFEKDPLVQAFLEKRRAEMLAGICHRLR